MPNLKHLLAAVLLLSTSLGVHAERLKDIASISGVRSNQLIGYGLVVGLNGTGDQTTQTPFTLQTFNNMLSQFGIKVPPGSGNVQLKNVAAVSISADLPAISTYRGLKSCFTSTPSRLLGRSRIWPIEATTS